MANASLVSSVYGSSTTKNALPVFGNAETFNLNAMVYKNITQSGYFLKLCQKVNDFQTAVDEIYYKVSHVMPFTPGESSVRGAKRRGTLIFAALSSSLTPHLPPPSQALLGTQAPPSASSSVSSPSGSLQSR